ncbi:hypothetical protein FHX37_2559 [Haloactinospora alba]|uniref:Uncharacterized protein n=2 Tax=Haloactinospora alba TaxID=405555 RepID=A0A543NL59_9ACTN|nr:hypothetical protein FHX37_2559 [Haloactinospora alba]
MLLGMDNDELTQRVRELREQGRSPKAIARTLGVSPSRVAPVVRAIAEEQPRPTENPVAGCWISPGWSLGLGVTGDPEWPDSSLVAEGDPGTDELVTVIVTRERRWGNVAVCTYLVDPYCLGVKHAYGPDVVDIAEIPPYVRRMYAPYGDEPVQAPVELAQELVFGSVAYARELGFEPDKDFDAAAGHLGEWNGPATLTFGWHGRPYYVPGPDDDTDHVLRTLERTVGAGNFGHAVESQDTSA